MIFLQEHVYTMLLFFSFLVGSAIGSFLNVFILRTVRGMSLNHPQSHCYSCGNQLSMIIDNIPILGWFILKGKCRSCGSTYDMRYSINELIFGLATTIIFVFSVNDHHLNLWIFVSFFTLAALLFTISYIDHDYQKIPDKITIPATTSFLIYSLFSAGSLPDNSTSSTPLQQSLFIIAMFMYLIYFFFSHTEYDARRQRLFHLACVTLNTTLPLFVFLFANQLNIKPDIFWDKIQAIVYLGGSAYIFSVAPRAFGLNSMFLAEGDAKLIILISSACGFLVSIEILKLWLFTFIIFSPLLLARKIKIVIYKKQLTTLGVLLTISSAVLFYNIYIHKVESIIIYALLSLFATSGILFFLVLKKCIDSKFIPDKIAMAPLLSISFLFWVILKQLGV